MANSGVATTDLVAAMIAGQRNASKGIPALDSGKATTLPSSLHFASSRSATAMVSFVMDDGPSTDYTEAYPIFAAAGVAACCAVVSSFVGTASHTTAAQILEMQAAGWEMCSHTRNHTNLTAVVDAATLLAELDGSKADLAALGIDTRILVYPNGGFNPTVDNARERSYRAGVGTDSATPANDYNTVDAITHTKLRRYNLDTATLVTAKAAVDAAKTNKTWLIFMLHTGNAGAWVPLKAWLPDLLAYITAQSVPVVTVSKGLDTIGPYFDSGDLRIAGSRTVFFPGRTRQLSDDAVSGANLPLDPLFKDYEETTCFCLNAGNDANLPTTGSGMLVTQRPAPGSNYYSMTQLWRPSRSPYQYVRFVQGGQTNVWGPWTRQDQRRAVGTLTINPGSIAAGAVYRFTAAGSPAWVVPVQATDVVSATPYLGLETGLIYSAFPYANSGIEIRIYNPTGAPIVAASRVWYVVASNGTV